MNHTTHKTDSQNRTFFVPFDPSNFNGKEKDHESGFHYYGARYYWSEVLTGWLSVDRYSDKYPSISPYAYCDRNPIIITDPSGDTLYALDRQSQLDIANLAGYYRNRIRFDERGIASIDYSGLSEVEIERMNAHLGVGLIKDIIDSPFRILYEASDLILCTYPDGGRVVGDLKNDNNGVINLSKNGLDSQNTHTYMPREGFDGQVVISPNGIWNSMGFLVPREEIVGHELAENYARTAFGCDYHPQNGGSAPMAKIGAHEYANQRMQNPHKDYSYKRNNSNNNRINYNKVYEYLR